jgi:adenylate kinase family enzyme
MALLGFDDDLPLRPRRVLVAGTSGSGKTTLATRIGSTLGVPQIEIDALYHGPDWTPRGSFRADVEQFAAQPDWVTEWQYGSVRALLTQRADLVVWLDLPLRVVMAQVVARTLRRRWRREVLWNGNVEPPLWTILVDREHIIRWAWSTRRNTGSRIQSLRHEQPALPVVRLRSRREANAWLAGPLTNSRG